MIRASDSIGALCAAMVAAQAEMPNVPKTTRGQVGNAVRFYADLAAVVEVVQPVLAAHGLGFVQFPCDAERGVAVTTRLFHKSGEWMESTVSMPSAGNGAQGVGSALTYCRRYSLMAVLGLAAEDDDGKAASPPQQRPAPTRQLTPKPAGRATAGITEAQTKALGAAFSGIGIRDRDERIAFISNAIGRQVTSSQELTKDEASQVFNAIDATLGTQGGDPT